MNNKLITFVDDINHSYVESFSNTYQSTVFFSENSVLNQNEYVDIYHNSYLYTYIQGVNNTKNTVLFKSGMFKIKYEDDKLCTSYIYFSDTEANIYPTHNEDYIQQNEYRFNIYHSDDINISTDNIFYNTELFDLRKEDSEYVLSIYPFNIPDESSTQTLLYYINNSYICTTLNIIKNTPEFEINTKRIIVNNQKEFTLPFSLVNNQNHEKIYYGYSTNYIERKSDLTFKAIKETNKNSYTPIWAKIGNNAPSYCYVTITPEIKAESMSIVKYPIKIENEEIIPYETSYNTAITGAANSFGIKFNPKNPTHTDIKWYSTDPSTLKIINDSSANPITVKYLRPGKVILYAIHEYKNDNYLRAIMTVNITGNVIITNIYDISITDPLNYQTQLTNVIDGQQIGIVIPHKPYDSEVALIFEDDAESYLSNIQDYMGKDMYQDINISYSYFLTYIDVNNWNREGTIQNNNISKSFSMNYGIDGTSQTNTINIYELYSKHKKTVAYVLDKNENYVPIPNTAYLGDIMKIESYYDVYPNGSVGSPTLNLSDVKNNSICSSKIRYSNNDYDINNTNITNINNNKINVTSKLSIDKNIFNNIVNTPTFLINEEYSYLYNIKNLEGTGSYAMYIKEPDIVFDGNKEYAYIAYKYTGNVISYEMNDNYNILYSNDNISDFSYEFILDETNNTKILNISRNRFNQKTLIKLNYGIQNNDYVKTGKFDINVEPVSLKINIGNNLNITNGEVYTKFVQNDNDEEILHCSYSTINTDLLYNDIFTISHDNNIIQLTPIDNHSFSLTKPQNAIGSNEYIEDNITIINTNSGCQTKFTVKFTNDKIYITNFDVSDNYNEQKIIYYNSTRTDKYQNNKLLTVHSDLSNNSSALSAILKLSYTNDNIFITGDSNVLQQQSDKNYVMFMSNNNHTKNIYVGANNKLNNNNSDIITFTYDDNNNLSNSINYTIKAYKLPQNINCEYDSNVNSLYENENINLKLLLPEYNDMSDEIKNEAFYSYEFPNSFNNVNGSQINNNQMTISGTLKQLNGNSSCPIIKHRINYNISSSYSFNGNNIEGYKNVYGIYTYMSYILNDNSYAGLNKNTELSITTYANPNNEISIENATSGINTGFTLKNQFSQNLTYEGANLNKIATINNYNFTIPVTSVNKINIKVKYKGQTYLNIYNTIYHPNIINNIENNIVTYTNGDDSTNWKKSFIISYENSGNWPNDYAGSWSYVFNNSANYSNGKYIPTQNSSSTGSQFKIKCDNIQSDSVNIITHTLCDKFELDESKSYLPIIVANNYPYVIYNKYDGVVSSSGEYIDIAPESYTISTQSNNYFGIDNNTNTITYNNITSSVQNINISYVSGFYNKTAQYNIYSISFGLTHTEKNIGINTEYYDLGILRTTSAKLPGYIYGISGGQLSYNCQNSYNVNITNNIIDTSNVTTNNIGKTLLVKTLFNYQSTNSTRKYCLENIDTIKILPYRNPYYSNIKTKCLLKNTNNSNDIKDYYEFRASNMMINSENLNIEIIRFYDENHNKIGYIKLIGQISFNKKTGIPSTSDLTNLYYISSTTLSIDAHDISGITSTGDITNMTFTLPDDFEYDSFEYYANYPILDSRYNIIEMKLKIDNIKNTFNIYIADINDSNNDIQSSVIEENTGSTLIPL